MNIKLAAVAGIALGLGFGGDEAIAQPRPAAPAMDFAALAEKLVGTNANVKEGQVVEIVAGPMDIALAEELAVAARKRGAHVLVTYESEALARKVLAGVPATFDSQARKLDLALAKLVDVRFVIPQIRDPAIGASIPPERARAFGLAAQAADAVLRTRKVKVVELGNGLAPSAIRAKELGLSEGDLKKLYWDGLTADYGAVEQKCTALKTALARGKELKITHPNGTDLTIAIKGKKVASSDGVISEADAKAGGPSVTAWLPAGEVFLAAGVANGKLVDDRMVAFGKDVLGLAFEIKAGKIATMTAKSGWDGPVKARYDAAGPGKTELSIVDFGCNPAVKGDKLESFIPAGVVTLGFGNNLWAGGANKEPYGMQVHLQGTTVLLDGKPIVANGALE